MVGVYWELMVLENKELLDMGICLLHCMLFIAPHLPYPTPRIAPACHRDIGGTYVWMGWFVLDVLNDWGWVVCFWTSPCPLPVVEEMAGWWMEAPPPPSRPFRPPHYDEVWVIFFEMDRWEMWCVTWVRFICCVVFFFYVGFFLLWFFFLFFFVLVWLGNGWMVCFMVNIALGGLGSGGEGEPNIRLRPTCRSFMRHLPLNHKGEGGVVWWDDYSNPALLAREQGNRLIKVIYKKGGGGGWVSWNVWEENYDDDDG